MIALLRQVADAGDSEGAQWAGMRIHRIASEMLTRVRRVLQAQRGMGILLNPARRGGAKVCASFFGDACFRSRAPLHPRSRCFAATGLSHGVYRHSCCPRTSHLVGVWGWSVLLLAPAAAILAAGLSGEFLLAHWTQTFMGSAARFIMQFFPIFLLGALFGKLMEDSGSVSAIADFMTDRLGPRRAMLAVVLAGALVPTAASACLWPSSCWLPWRIHCFAQQRFRSG